MTNGSMQAGPATRVVIRCIVYYAILIGGATLLWPYLPRTGGVPVIGMDAMFGAAGRHAPVQALDEASLTAGVAMAMLGSVLLSLPVAWVYLVTRAKRGYQQSVVQLLIVLPAVVSGVVLGLVLALLARRRSS